MRMNSEICKVVGSEMRYRPSTAKTLLRGAPYTALMIVNPHGQPANDQIIGHGTKRIVGTVPSRKCGQTFPWQSFNERDRILTHEADTGVHSYLAQPHILYFVTGGKIREYRPDCAIDRDGAPIQIEEVKDERYDPARHPEHEAKYAEVRKIYDAIGWQFTVKRVLKTSAAHTSSMRAVQEIVGDRWTEVTPEDLRLVRQGLRALGGSGLMATVEKMLPFPQGIARAKINAMVVRRVLHVNLERRLSPVTIVSLFDAVPRKSRLAVKEVARG